MLINEVKAKSDCHQTQVVPVASWKMPRASSLRRQLADRPQTAWEGFLQTFPVCLSQLQLACARITLTQIVSQEQCLGEVFQHY